MSADWIARAQSRSLEIRNFVDGQSRSGAHGQIIEKLSSRNGQLLYLFQASDARDVDQAVLAARRAFADGRWSKLPVQRRRDVLCRLAALIEQHLEELALLESLDVGKPIRDALSIDVPAAAARIRFNAEAADKCYGNVYGVDQSSLSYQLYRPIGVVAGIIGWNFPLVLAAEKMAPALAAGNCVVLKPAELTSLTAGRLAELAREAGVPDGVFNVVHGAGEVGAALARHRDVDLLTFTGSTQTGKRLMIAAGESNMKRLILECGGKAPNIVFEDCPDLLAVADAVVARAFWNQGQVCTASSRLLVHERIKEPLLAILIERVAALRLGDPLDPETRFGPLMSQDHKRKVLRYIGIGAEEGARIVHRGTSPSPDERGAYVSPVIFDGVELNHTIAQEEIFGPVLSILTFRDEAAAIRMANDTIYGLSAIVWTRDMGRAHRLTQALDSGWIVVNTSAQPAGGPGSGVLSIGGHKESGVGIEGGVEGLKAYLSQTAVQVFC